MGTHEQCVGATDEWYTPPYIFSAMGWPGFDMDVAHPGGIYATWIPAHKFIIEGSLDLDWRGFIWMNPPFGGRNGLIPWLDKFMTHGNGIALTPDRTSAPWWKKYASRADAILFISPKVKFIGRDGLPGKSPAQGTSLLASGVRAVETLQIARNNGLGTLVYPKGD